MSLFRWPPYIYSFFAISRSIYCYALSTGGTAADGLDAGYSFFFLRMIPYCRYYFIPSLAERKRAFGIPGWIGVTSVENR